MTSVKEAEAQFQNRESRGAEGVSGQSQDSSPSAGLELSFSDLIPLVQEQKTAPPEAYSGVTCA